MKKFADKILKIANSKEEWQKMVAWRQSGLGLGCEFDLGELRGDVTAWLSPMAPSGVIPWHSAGPGALMVH